HILQRRNTLCAFFSTTHLGVSWPTGSESAHACGSGRVLTREGLAGDGGAGRQEWCVLRGEGERRQRRPCVRLEHDHRRDGTLYKPTLGNMCYSSLKLMTYTSVENHRAWTSTTSVLCPRRAPLSSISLRE